MGRRIELVLLGRQEERERVDSLLAKALARESAVLIISGEAGIGKSALLEDLVERATGLLVLRARGFETDSELAFSGLADLLRPLLGRIDLIPEAQAEALRGALAIGPPVEADRFAVCAATLSLLAAVAEETPVLALIDDAQWIDASSLETVIFAVRRLDAEGIAVVFAAREGETPLLDRAGLPQLLLPGLDVETSTELLTEQTDDLVVPPVAQQLAVATGGNPLALVEIPTLLTRDQLTGREVLPDELPVVPTIERSFMRQLSALPEESRVALTVAAATESGGLNEITEALAALGLGIEALDAAEAAKLVLLSDDRVVFRHPLLRTTAYRSASTATRRGAHQALARTALHGAATPRQAWHLAAAAPEQDEAAAVALEEAARETRHRGGLSESSAAFERAANLTGDDARRGRLLREAASDARLLGQMPRATEMLERALPLAREPVERARVQHLRGVIEMWNGSPLRAYELLAQEAERIASIDAGRAVRMLTDAVWAVLLAGRVETGVEVARRAVSLAETADSEQAVARALLGVGLVLRGESATALSLFSDYYERLSGDLPADADYREVARPAGQVLMWYERYEEARSVLTRAIEAARGASALGPLPYALAELAEVQFRTGDWVAAYASATEAVQLAEDIGQEGVLAYSLACLAQIEAAQGREDDCREHARRALELGHTRLAAAVAYATRALGLLELGLGRPDIAVSQLETLAERLGEHGLREPGVIQWTPDLVEAYARTGRGDKADQLLTAFEAAARDAERIWALAASSRCRGILAETAFEKAFSDALELHHQTPTPFERARTELCLGERLRRARRRSDARVPLRGALETFELLGAAPWAVRARRELAATGEIVQTGRTPLADELTPAELQVALLVAGGSTNKEAAAALFLSAKTVEAHLGRIYRKLGLRSRTELAARFAGANLAHAGSSGLSGPVARGQAPAASP
jgi:DNA-binding CsgD family transcriptional regulator